MPRWCVDDFQDDHSISCRSHSHYGHIPSFLRRIQRVSSDCLARTTDQNFQQPWGSCSMLIQWGGGKSNTDYRPTRLLEWVTFYAQLLSQKYHSCFQWMTDRTCNFHSHWKETLSERLHKIMKLNNHHFNVKTSQYDRRVKRRLKSWVWSAQSSTRMNVCNISLKHLNVYQM